MWNCERAKCQMQPIKRGTNIHINKLCKIKNAVNQYFTAFVGMTGFEYFPQIIYIQYINTSVLFELTG
jgi:hypothetical protein